MRPNIEEIRERVKKATPGLWEGGRKLSFTVSVRPDCEFFNYAIDSDAAGITGFLGTKDDAEFVAHAREDIPTLLDYINHLEEVLKDRTNDITYYEIETKRQRVEIEQLRLTIRNYQLSEYNWQCGKCKWFQKSLGSRERCDHCKITHYLSGSFKREDLERWFDEHHQELEGDTK